jgi:hypothetical protein
LAGVGNNLIRLLFYIKIQRKFEITLNCLEILTQARCHI